MVESGLKYQMPPAELAAIAHALPLPSFLIGPHSRYILALQQQGLIPLSELAQPKYRLAGLRFNPQNLSVEPVDTFIGLSFIDSSDGNDNKVQGLPAGACVRWVSWAPDGSAVAFVLVQENKLTLWLAATSDTRARPVSDQRLNAVAGQPYCWLPDSTGFVCRLAAGGSQETPPPGRGLPAGPMIEEHVAGPPAPARTNPDLLRDSVDETLFEYYLNSDVAIVQLDGTVHQPGLSGGIISAVPSPDAQFLLIQTLHRPYSHHVVYGRFPLRVEIFDMQGQPVARLADLPLDEAAALGTDTVRPGPRSVHWRPDCAATLAWCEALDEGNPAAKAQWRDRLMVWDLPDQTPARELARFEFRCRQVQWGDGQLALAHETWRKTRTSRIWRLKPEKTDAAPNLLRSWQMQDRYADPGTPLLKPSGRGGWLLAREEKSQALLFAGEGAGPAGDRPFVDAIDPAGGQARHAGGQALHAGGQARHAGGQARRLWQSQANCYEQPVTVFGKHLLFTRETAATPPDLYISGLTRENERRLTVTPHPLPAMAKTSKQLISYQRADGVSLTGTLHLPPGMTEADGPFPTLLWAYPTEYKDAASAGQVKGSPHRFSVIAHRSPLVWLTRGYAVLERPDMPIIGSGDTEPNDTYIEQLVASAEAAVAELIRRGVSSRDGIAIGGLSYGGFMTANLLAHTRLFRAGIAWSGAYNRTLTPFTFQAEERTLWQARDVYLRMSPFLHADGIRDPLLLIHGALDENDGTAPFQSERLYQALKGLGRPARLVMLPYEEHRYRARESVLHLYWEMDRWLSRHLRPPTEPTDCIKPSQTLRQGLGRPAN